jgi:hypothetical protein
MRQDFCHAECRRNADTAGEQRTGTVDTREMIAQLADLHHIIFLRLKGRCSSSERMRTPQHADYVPTRIEFEDISAFLRLAVDRQAMIVNAARYSSSRTQ